MAEAIFNVNIYTPDCQLGAFEASLLVCPALDGEIGIMANHSPMLCALKEGITRITLPGGEVRRISTPEGFLSVKNNTADIICG